MGEAFRIAVNVSEQIGCRAVIVDAYAQAVAWYERYGFQAIEGNEGRPVRMYLDIRTIRAARGLN
jgi:hypothetical protein